MNIKKILQEMAEKDAEKFLTEEDERFIEELVRTYVPKETTKKPKRKWWRRKDKDK